VTANALVTLDAILDAAARIRGVARITPLLPVSLPGEPRVLVKCENLQLAGAFKFRGAYNMVSRLTDAERRRGVITYSSGNHGQAVALAARLLGAPAVIVMPTTAPAIKVEGARGYGAEVMFEGTTSLHRKQRAEIVAAERGLTMVPPFDHEWIIAGQGTVGIEIAEQEPEVGRVYVPVGGGGLLSGVAAAVKRRTPGARVVGVEPAGAAKMQASRQVGRPVTLPAVASIADGLLPVRPGDLTFAHARALVDDLITVEEDEIARAAVWLFRHAKLVVEPSGATSFAGLVKVESREGQRSGAGGAAIAVLSGGNVALARLAELEAGLTAPPAPARPAGPPPAS
jgi:threonine dehydratase